MAARTNERRHAVCRLAALERHCPDDPRTTEARQEVERLKVDAKIRALVDNAPALTPAQRDRLAVLLDYRPTT